METILQTYLKEIKKQKKQQNIYLCIFVFTTILFVYSIYNYFQSKSITMIIICLLIYVLLAILNDQINQRINNINKKIEVIELYKHKKDRDIDSYDDGLSYPHDISLEDLDIVGKHSLFQYMNMARSVQGKSRLIQRFENSKNDIKQYHESILELQNHKEFIISYISSIPENIDLYATIQFMNMKAKKANLLLIFDSVLDLAVVLCGILELFHLFPQYSFIYVLAFHYFISYFYSMIYSEYFKGLYKSIKSLSDLQYKIDIEFKSELLSEIKNSLTESQKVFSLIKNIETLYAYDQNIFSSILLNGLISLKLRIVIKINDLLNYDLQKYINSLIDLELLISLSTPLLLNEEVVHPVIDDHLEFECGKHPLIQNCTSNSYKQNQKVCIITGSNMSGKTSFLRMMGVNMTLMNAGSYVFATSFHAPICRVYTSMRIRDDLQHGISTFYGELLRIKDILDDPVIKLVLIDEIFKGTNYQDRITGALQVIQNLQKQHSMSFITTHDFQLCDQKEVDNYYFKEEYIDQEIYFDYKIHPGKNTSSNAIFLMKRAGIIKEGDNNETVENKMD